ncbi:MAG TPA: hypothetical protein VFK80_09785, partial [Limnochordia bacterium]|nr:hypothetical protein [Limnochordia bacterium]
ADSAPTIVRIIGAIGAVAMGLAGPVVDGFHWLALGPLYMGAMPLGFWIIWTGAVIAFRRPATVSAANV